MRCEHLTMPRTMGRGNSSHRCSRTAVYVVRVMRIGTVQTMAMCTYHARNDSNVQTCHPIIEGGR